MVKLCQQEEGKRVMLFVKYLNRLVLSFTV